MKTNKYTYQAETDNIVPVYVLYKNDKAIRRFTSLIALLDYKNRLEEQENE